MNKIAYLIVNFGGPRTLQEVEPFLRALLTDKDVIRSPLPQSLHNLFFGRIAKKRAKKVSEDYLEIGGGSPIWSDTEYLAEALRHKLGAPVLTFHRYLPKTHAAILEELKVLECSQLIVFPCFPQFTYATTGSIARFFTDHLPQKVVQKMFWVKSYPSHPAFVQLMQKMIREFLEIKNLKEEETFLLFSAHGVPKVFIETGDSYQFECQSSFDAVMKGLPSLKALLCYQSKFGRGEWIRPYTSDVVSDITQYIEDRKACLFVPISFTSDHIETLFEVEDEYMPVIKEQGFPVYRLPAFNRDPAWIEAITQIMADFAPCTTSMLVR